VTSLFTVTFYFVAGRQRTWMWLASSLVFVQAISAFCLMQEMNRRTCCTWSRTVLEMRPTYLIALGHATYASDQKFAVSFLQ